MRVAGLDVGSRTVVLVVREGNLSHQTIVDTGANPLKRCRELFGSESLDRLVVTGYGRHLVAGEVGGEAVSEITAYAVGARHLYPDCRTVLDIGGQDSKAIQLASSGEVAKFEMNDRCAAGTGRFLEVMASTLEVPIDNLGGLALGAVRAVSVNSLCTVFAESEVVSLIARGEASETIALGVHEAIATRLAAMARRVGVRERVVFAGGGALNPCLASLLSQKLGLALAVPESPQAVGALGAALLAEKRLVAEQPTDEVEARGDR